MLALAMPEPNQHVVELTHLGSRLLRARLSVVLIRAADGDALELIASCPNEGGAIDAQWMALADDAARAAVDANGSVAVERSAESNGRGRARTRNAKALAAPVRSGADAIGALVVIGPHGKRSFGEDERATLECLASVIGQALQTSRLQRVLASRFAQVALAAEASEVVEAAVNIVTGHPAQLARILAKSFYREMMKLGFTSGQIIDAASEIVSQLSGNLRRHADRQRRDARGAGETSG